MGDSQFHFRVRLSPNQTGPRLVQAEKVHAEYNRKCPSSIAIEPNYLFGFAYFRQVCSISLSRVLRTEGSLIKPQHCSSVGRASFFFLPIPCSYFSFRPQMAWLGFFHYNFSYHLLPRDERKMTLLFKERDRWKTMSLSRFELASVSCGVAPGWDLLKDALPTEL